MVSIALRGGRTVALSRRIYSWGDTGSVLGSAVNYNDYTRTTTGKIVDDPDYIFATQRSVRTVIKFLARNIASVTLHSYMPVPETPDPGDRKRARGTSISNWTDSPSPYHTYFDFIYQMVIDYAKHERYLAEKVKHKDGRIEVVPIPASKWEFVRDGVNRPVGVQIHGQEQIRNTIGGDFFWMDDYPDDVSGMAALLPLLNEQKSGNDHRQKMWDSGARIPGIVTRPSAAPPWTPKARTNFLNKLANFEAGGDADGRHLMLEDDMGYERGRVVSPRDAQQLDSDKLSEAQVAAAFGIPPVFVGLMDNANYSNVSAFRDALFGDTLGPWFQQIQQALNQRIVKEFGEPGEFVEFHVDGKLSMSFKDKFEIIQSAVGTPVMSPNEGRKLLNLRSAGAKYDEVIIPSYIQDAETQGASK